jgi:hypothetical protein
MAAARRGIRAAHGSRVLAAWPLDQIRKRSGAAFRCLRWAHSLWPSAGCREIWHAQSATRLAAGARVSIAFRYCPTVLWMRKNKMPLGVFF